MNEGEFIVDLENPDKTNQLSAKGMCLLMAIFAEEEGNENQPVIAGSIESLAHVIGLIDDSPPETELTIIFNPSQETEESWEAALGRKKYHREFSSFHKTTLNIKKAANGDIIISHLDGASTNPDYINIPNLLVLMALDLNAKKRARKPSELISLEPDFPVNPTTKERVFTGSRFEEIYKKFVRQRDMFNCGIYAIKDARYFTRNPTIISTDRNTIVQTDFGSYATAKFVVTPAMLRSSQSDTTLDYLRSDNFDQGIEVNRKGLFLSGFLNKYSKAGAYIKKFAEKYLAKVSDYLSKNPDEVVQAMARKYDCAYLTLDDVARLSAARSAPPMLLSRSSSESSSNSDPNTETKLNT